MDEDDAELIDSESNEESDASDFDDDEDPDKIEVPGNCLNGNLIQLSCTD